MKRTHPETNPPAKLKTIRLGNGDTATIYQRQRPTKSGGVRTVYSIADYATGKRILRSFSDQAEAEQAARKAGSLKATGQTIAARMKDAEAASYGRAIQLLRPTGLSLEIAAATMAEVFKILGGNRAVEAAQDFIRRNPTERPRRTVAEVAAELVDLKAREKKGPRYLEDLRTRLAAFGRGFSSVNVDTIGTTDVQGCLDSMTGAQRTKKNFRDTVNSLFKFAETRGYIGRGENPIAHTDKIKSRDDAAIEIYSPEEITKLLKASPEWFKPVIAIQAFAGLRSAEVMRLSWSDVKVARGHIELTAAKAKTRSRRLAPITANLTAWLATHAKAKGAIFPHSKAYFHEVQAKVARFSGVTWKHNALRHSFISYRVADISDVAKVALEAGNSPAMIFSNYRELVDTPTAHAWFNVTPEQAAA